MTEIPRSAAEMRWAYRSGRVREFLPMPDDNGGADIGLVVLDDQGKPTCVSHGAMNKVSAEGFWRCIATSSARGNTCRAACREVWHG